MTYAELRAYTDAMADLDDARWEAREAELGCCMTSRIKERLDHAEAAMRLAEAARSNAGAAT
jgi:hypothetical protein